MNNEIWQQLLLLETSDFVFDWHKKIKKQKLNKQRISEITSAAKQGREYFRNSLQAHTSVRSLLTFYGVASLSRAALLLLKEGTGEPSLTQGHGLTAVEWKKNLSGDILSSIQKIGNLKVKTTSGLLSDLINSTENTICLHIHSSGVDCGLIYNLPPLNIEIEFEALITRIPDLFEYLPKDSELKSAHMNNLKNTEEGAYINANTKQIKSIIDHYTSKGYSIAEKNEKIDLFAPHEIFNQAPLQFIHTYINKSFSRIPKIYITTPLSGSAYYSQIAITYILSYFLGMLTRYFPTQWVALSNGTKGDRYWPAISAAQRYIEHSFPELILELIQHKLDEAEKEEQKKE